jgi:hypothetical protein
MLLNFAGVRPDLIQFMVHRNPTKQGKTMPGSRLPIVDEAHLRAYKPDQIVILPWDLREEVMVQLDYIRNWGGKYVTVVPPLEVL